MMLEHATYPRSREETLPEPRVLYPRREHSQGLRRPGEHLSRLLGLPAPLVKIADPALDLPKFPRLPDLLGERFGFAQVIYRPFRVAFPFAQDRKGAKIGHPIPLVRPGALGETAHLLSGESFVPSSQQRFDLVVEVDAEHRVEKHAHLLSYPGVRVGVLPVLRESGQHAKSGVGE